jgi:hypothetical protein
LPLGLADKLFLSLSDAAEFDKESRLFGRTDCCRDRRPALVPRASRELWNNGTDSCRGRVLCIRRRRALAALAHLTDGAQIPIEPAARSRPTSRGFVPWRVSYAGPGVPGSEPDSCTAAKSRHSIASSAIASTFVAHRKPRGEHDFSRPSLCAFSPHELASGATDRF